MTELIGVAAAIWPRAWLGLFGSDPGMLATGTAYLHVVGPFYGFFGLGSACISRRRARVGWAGRCWPASCACSSAWRPGGSRCG